MGCAPSSGKPASGTVCMAAAKEAGGPGPYEEPTKLQLSAPTPPCVQGIPVAIASSSSTAALTRVENDKNAAASSPSLDSSTHSGCSAGSSKSNWSSNSTHSRKRSETGSTSALGLDKMIDEQRDAKTMSERVVHIEVPFGKPIEEVYSGVHDGPVLGSGISGIVRLATHQATGIKYAVKCLDLNLVDTEEGLQQLREEIYIMCQLDHPNIVRLEEVYESHSEIYLVQELCLGGELFDRLDEQPDYHYTEAQCAQLSKQMLCAVRYLHSKGIIHRDLKLENFLFSDTGADSGLKMIDFGLSKHFKLGEVHHDAVGTPYTVAPEVLLGSYDERCDVWAIGVITYLLLSGESPFGGCGGPESLMQVRENIINCNYVFQPEDIWESVSDSGKQYIRRLLVTDVNMRPTAREVQKDSWLVMANRSKDDNDRALNPSVVKALVNFKEYSDMRKLLSEVLSFTMIPDQIQGLRNEFEKMDTDGSGEISLSALQTVLLGNAAQGSLGALTEEEVEDIFNAMRVSSTETTIHWHEFIAAGLSHCKVDERNMKLAFDRLDADHTGYITFDNFVDLIGNCTGYSEEALRQMWGESSTHSSEAHITYEDFLLLMKGQAKSPMLRPMTPKIDSLPLHAVMEDNKCSTLVEPSLMMGGCFTYSSSFRTKEELEQSTCTDQTGDSKASTLLNQGFSFDDKSKTNLAVNSEFRRVHRSMLSFSEYQRTDDSFINSFDDKPKTNLAVNSELRRAHRSMRLAVLEASKRLEQEQQRRAREEMRKEQALSNKRAGLIMRHGGELSAAAIAQFVAQQQKEEQKKVQAATKRAGRRHHRTRTSSDIRLMYGGSGCELSKLKLPPKLEPTAVGDIPDFGGQSLVLPHAAPPKPPFAPEPLDLPKVRDATTPGQFRTMNYDPFSLGVRKSLTMGP